MPKLRKVIEKKVKVSKGEPKNYEVLEVSVYEGRNLIRTYSKKAHGEDFMKLAMQFVSDRPTFILK
jgi:hypothetical protein